ncbi:MAG: flavodoxin-dependent (E)-4-hydroxy-3-methylbut-2-enyl-diphosphate synthase [Cyanobacteria bacterium HKST-UBA06]|nr:flavodoxin-dependent (E)-4-hydroxy-3-methylbut-2-enyl-diphosphate synthase [Cyanobacteria bacterium HKST-UBA04]MCA9806417.1 flavodoxin-dependent (E)-4-hydroxy-3-methylbut-2-enyl-diphosphate synthase [Cyanobacteria bacterium HKST-UBA06]MCA9841501.1 flavodoxin-dependent (E)-4-hydroxy-3-methylbut-2-enyl-diphosphate synthase [Cyanobacteria bacterium HKST-UBA03]
MSIAQPLQPRRKSRQLHVGRVAVGGDAPVSVQSMTVTDTRDVVATLDQIEQLAEAGCDIVRLAVPDKVAADALKQITARSPIPVIADIHFDYRLALMAADNGVQGLRVNPGNQPKKDFIRQIADKAKACGLPIRIGVNAGSLEKPVKEKFPNDMVSALVESALLNVRLLEEQAFFDIKVSVKASDPMTMIRAYRRVAEAMPYPLHLGVTEAGTLKRGLIKSSVGIGMLLAEGIGDTIRVSLTADPVEEVTAGHEILKAVGLRMDSADLISCPSCGRAEVDLHGMANQVEALITQIKLPVRVAVMGCFVNGPGEAEQADIGIAGAKDEFFIFEGLEVIKRVPQAVALEEFKHELDRFVRENETMLRQRMDQSKQAQAVLLA